MSGEANPSPTDVVVADLKRYGDELAPGGAEALGSVWGSLGTWPSDKRAEEIEKRMGSGLADRYRNSEHVPRKLENGADASPLRRILDRHSDQLRDGQVDVLVGKLAVQTNGKSPAQIAGVVARFLASRDAEPHTTGYRQPPAHEQRTIDRLQAHFGGEMPYDGIVALARDRGHELNRFDDRMFVQFVARSLQSGAVASKYGAGQIAKGDPRLTAQGIAPPPRRQPTPTPQPPREADGRFASPPSRADEKVRKPLAF